MHQKLLLYFFYQTALFYAGLKAIENPNTAIEDLIVYNYLY